jgi:hypothetical protein
MPMLDAEDADAKSWKSQIFKTRNPYRPARSLGEGEKLANQRQARLKTRKHP